VIEERSSWAVGWTIFASIMLMLGGAFQAIYGMVALFNDEFYVVGQDWTFAFDVTTWGWVHLILGIAVALAGAGLFSGNVAARSVGVIVASISAVANFMSLPYYPIWSTLVIVLDIAVIWALTLHGRDITVP
jgi:hypothetical protein